MSDTAGTPSTEGPTTPRATPPPLPGDAGTLGYAEQADRREIPWQRRKRIGRFVGFWGTVFRVVRRNGRLGEAMDKPVPLRDAVRFRRLAVVHGLVGFVAGGVGALAIVMKVGRSGVAAEAKAAAPTAIAVLLAGLLAIPLSAGLVSWFFCPRRLDDEQQDRAIALSCYLSAPLALLLPWAALQALWALVATEAGPTAPVWLGLIAGWFGVAVMSLLPWLYWWQLVVSASLSIARRDTAGAAATAALVPVGWAVTFFACLMLVLSALMWTVLGLSLS